MYNIKENGVSVIKTDRLVDFLNSIDATNIVVKLLYNKKVILINETMDVSKNNIQRIYCLADLGKDNITVVDGYYNYASTHNFGVDNYTLEQKIYKVLSDNYIISGCKCADKLLDSINNALDCKTKWLKIDIYESSFIASNLSKNDIKISKDCDGEIIINNLYTGLSIEQLKNEIDKRRSVLGDDVILSFVVKGFY